jgi:hypothetical protein
MMLGLAGLVGHTAHAQLFIDQATFTIQAGATVTVQGDVTSNTDIQGTGKVILKGTANQNVNVGGFNIPNLEIDNAANVTLTGNARIGSSLQFTNGKIFLGANNLTLAAAATSTGAGASKFVEANGAGELRKELTANVTNFEMPIGVGIAYRPVFITTNGTYASANVGVKALAGAHPNKPVSISDYIAANWPITRTGVTGTVTASGQYADPSDVTGTEANLRGYFYNGTEWSSTGGTNDAALNRVGVPIAANGTLYGMDKFIYVKAKAFLQGAFNSGTGVMNDLLRKGTSVAPGADNTNKIPLSDPYRTATYNTLFTHVANNTTETANASVFSDQANANDNIVDWVFIQLRNSTVSPGNTVLQTRSALVQRDGDIVDIDGVSPVTFNNVANGSYTIAVRHRNHLGISADPATNLYAAAEAKATATLLDLTVATDNQIFGTSAAYNVIAGKNVMWAGNARNTTANSVLYLGFGNDKDYILTTPAPNGVGGLASVPQTNTYSQSDLNLNRTASYLGFGNDKDYLLSTILGNVATAIRTQALPN